MSLKTTIEHFWEQEWIILSTILEWIFGYRIPHASLVLLHSFCNKTISGKQNHFQSRHYQFSSHENRVQSPEAREASIMCSLVP